MKKRIIFFIVFILCWFKIETIGIRSDLDLTFRNVYKKIIEYDIQHPKIVFSQVILETGHLTSGGALNDNNLFGFTTKNGHMSFETWEHSVQYYKKWQDKRYIDGDYYQFLQNINYAEDTLYINKIIKIEYGLERIFFRNC